MTDTAEKKARNLWGAAALSRVIDETELPPVDPRISNAPVSTPISPEAARRHSLSRIGMIEIVVPGKGAVSYRVPFSDVLGRNAARRARRCTPSE